jgi:hypothetical protein
MMTSGGGVSINDALGAERKRARCRRISETSDVALAIVFVCREGRRPGPVWTGRVCQQWRADAVEAFEDQWSAAARTAGTVVFAGRSDGTVHASSSRSGSTSFSDSRIAARTSSRSMFERRLRKS